MFSGKETLFTRSFSILHPFILTSTVTVIKILYSQQYCTHFELNKYGYSRTPLLSLYIIENCQKSKLTLWKFMERQQVLVRVNIDISDIIKSGDTKFVIKVPVYYTRIK